MVDLFGVGRDANFLFISSERKVSENGMTNEDRQSGKLFGEVIELYTCVLM